MGYSGTDCKVCGILGNYKAILCRGSPFRNCGTIHNIQQEVILHLTLERFCLLVMSRLMLILLCIS